MTTRNIITILLALAAFLPSRADNVKEWSAGPLVWNDFKDTALLEGSPAFLSSDIVLTTEQTSGGAFSMQARAVMYPDKSYASEAERTPQRLRYFQAQFDLAEILARRLQQELTSGINGIEADRRLNYYRNLFKTESRRLADDTQSGADDERLQQCEYTLREQLERIGEPGMPEVVPSAFRYGLFAGTGFVATTGELADYFNTAWDFSFGLLFNWRRLGLEASITYASPTLKDQLLTTDKYAGQNYHANVKNANYLAIGVNAGYNVVDGKHFLIRPYIGGMWTSYSWTARPMADDTQGSIVFDGLQQRMTLNDFNLTFGVNFEWHFHSTVTRFPLFGSTREEYISSLRLTPYAIHSSYSKASTPFSGWQIGLTVAYSGVGRALKLK